MQYFTVFVNLNQGRKGGGGEVAGCIFFKYECHVAIYLLASSSKCTMGESDRKSDRI